jgi:hypothetical protein
MATPQRSSTLHSALATGLLLLGVLLGLGPGRALEFEQIDLDRHLVVVESTHDVVSVGDRVVLLGEVPVAGARSAVWSFPTGQSPILTTIETLGAPTTHQVDGSSAAALVAAQQGRTLTIVSVDGEARNLPFSEEQLGALLETAPEGVEIELRELIRRQGPLAALPSDVSVPGVLWLILGVLAGSLAVLARQRRTSEEELEARLAQLSAASVAAAALTALATQPLTPPVMEGWAMVSLGVAAALHMANRTDRTPLDAIAAGAAVVIPILLYVPALGFALPVAALAGSNAVLAAASVAVIAALELLTMLRGALVPGASTASITQSRTSLGSAIGAGAILTIGWLGQGEMHLEAAALAGLTLVVPPWCRLVWRMLVGERTDTVRAGTGSCSVLLGQASRVMGRRRVGLAYPQGDRFALVERSEHELGSTGGLVARWADEVTANAFAMMSLEGEMYPRNGHQLGMDEEGEDPLAGVFDRLGVELVQPAGGAVPGFVVVWADESPARVDLEFMAAWIARTSWGSALEEAMKVPVSGVRARGGAGSTSVAGQTGAGSSSVGSGSGTGSSPDLREVVRVRSTLPEGTRITATTDTPSVRVASPMELAPPVDREQASPAAPSERVAPIASANASTTGARPAPSAESPVSDVWMRSLERMMASRYDFDNPEVLNEAEWRHLERFAETRKPALLMGEPGVGKEFIARAIHTMAPGASGRFATIDCALMAPAVAEVELFGDEEMPGLVEATRGGTLLVRAGVHLGVQRLEQLLASCDRHDVRLILAERYQGAQTSIPTIVPTVVRRAVDTRFMMLAPLRERRGEIVRYGRVFLHRFAMMYDRQATEFDEEAAAWLTQQDLPCNFTDLEQLVRSATVRSQGPVVTRADLAGPGSGAAFDADGDDDAGPYSEAERTAILQALDACDGNRSEAARRLNMARGKLLRRMKKYGIRG